MRLRPLLAAALLGMCALGGVRAELSVLDDAGRQVRLARPAARIVSLAPHATELLFAAGAGSRVVGAVAYSDYPAEAEKIPRVGDAHAIDLERVVALRPDLVIGWQSGNGRAQLDRLAAAGLALYLSEPRRAEDVASSLERIGTLAGTVELAATAAQRYRAELAALAADHAGKPAVSMFYEIWHEPIMTLNGQHLVSDILSRCGVRNVFAQSPSLVTTVSLEAVIAAAPESIATGAGETAVAFWKSRREIPAAREARVCASDPVRLHRAGPRLIAAAREVCDCSRRGQPAALSRPPR